MTNTVINSVLTITDNQMGMLDMDPIHATLFAKLASIKYIVIHIGSGKR